MNAVKLGFKLNRVSVVDKSTKLKPLNRKSFEQFFSKYRKLKQFQYSFDLELMTTDMMAILPPANQPTSNLLSYFLLKPYIQTFNALVKKIHEDFTMIKYKFDLTIDIFS